MQVIILGSGSPLPDPNRAGPSTLIRMAPLGHCSLPISTAITSLI
jgi:ribonuclease BN (tRNA processing enzyme)